MHVDEAGVSSGADRVRDVWDATGSGWVDDAGPEHGGGFHVLGNGAACV